MIKLYQLVKMIRFYMLLWVNTEQNIAEYKPA